MLSGRWGHFMIFQRRASVLSCLTAMLATISAGFVALPAMAGDAISKGPPPAWVMTAASPEDVAAPSEAGLRALLFDHQIHADGDEESSYVRYRLAAQTPQALAYIGTVTLVWSPDSQDVVVHHVNIVRDGRIIDVLADQAFETLRREENLERAMLDGRLTAVLQPAGLRVGDVIDTAYTVVSRDPVIAGHAGQAVDFNLPMAADRVHFRASWTGDRPVRLRAVDDWTPLPVRRQGRDSSVEVEMADLQPILIPEDVPVRFRKVRRIEFTDYADWSQISALLTPLYDRARTLEPDSALQVEIERIRALSDDPAMRTAAALRLVQDQIRYVALMMGEGALTPASADDTWRRRFGDCKAKTALLLALLDGLGIKAVPAAVSTQVGDGMNQSLPMVGAFDHVLVRAEIDGRPYWLDGTRTGDRRLEDIAVPPFHWALPLTTRGEGLERLVVQPLKEPGSEVLIAVDASAGIYAPAAVSASQIIRRDAAAVAGPQLGIASAGQREQILRAIWSGQIPDLVITEVGSAYDAELNTLTLSMTGTLKLDWAATGLVPPGGSFFFAMPQERTAGPFKETPVAIAHPMASRQVATLKLPADGQGFRLSGGMTDRAEGGGSVRRTSRLEGDTITITTDIRTLTNEISAADAARDRTVDQARPRDPPRVFVPEAYRPSDADRTAWTADEPTTASAWLDRAVALSQAGDNAGAVAAADKAVALEPDSSIALANRGVYRFWTGDREAAAVDLDRASDIDPSERIAMNGHALLAMFNRQFQDAVIELSRALRQVPNDSFALGLRSQAYMGLQQYDRALRDIDAMIAAQPNVTEFKLRRVAMLNASGREDDAEREMDALAEANPADRRMLINQAAIKVARGRGQAAVDILDRTLGLYEERPQQVLILRAEAYAMMGRLDEAAQDFATMRNADPDDAGILNTLCWTAAKGGFLLDEAVRDCDASVAASDGAAGIMDSKARLLLQRGDPGGALAIYDAALAKAPEQAASLYGRGLARIALGQASAGEADKAAALSLNPAAAADFKNYRPESAAVSAS